MENIQNPRLMNARGAYNWVFGKAKIMALPKLVEPYFDAWIGVNTWYTEHSLDLKKFYKFVWAVHRYCRPRRGAKKTKKRLPSESEIREAIIEARRDSFNAKCLADEARHYSRLYSYLLDFANTPNEVDYMIEKRDILMYYFQLSHGLAGHEANSVDIAAIMKRVWGENWREKLEREKKRLG